MSRQQTEVRGQGATRAEGGMLRALLRVPLFYKILIANAVLVTLGALGAVLGRSVVAPERITWGLVLLFVGLGVVASVVVNALILRLALRPLDDLEATAERVHAGDVHARARLDPVADASLERLIVTFNEMLDGVTTYRTRLRDMAARALAATEEERQRIALELHDDTAQTLAALLVQLRVARAAGDAQVRDAQLDDVRERIAGALEGVRRIAQGLRPPALDLGLAHAVETHAQMLSQATGIRIETDAEPTTDRLTSDAELALYRIIQEALSNAVRHADADLVRVVIATERAFVRAAVEDNGRGFSLDEAMQDGKGIGLFGMRERAAYVGGDVNVDSARGRGTRVDIQIPITGVDEHV